MTNVKKMSALTATFFMVMTFLLPVFTYSQTNESATSSAGLTGITYECGSTPETAGNCTFQDLLSAVKRFTNFLVTLALSLSSIVLVYAGYNYMISGDNSGKRTEANKMLTSVLKGIAWILAAWLVVTLITNALLTAPVQNLVPLK